MTAGASALVAAFLGGGRATQDAAANGDTRTIYLIHDHTKEEGAFTFKKNGYYDHDVLKQLNWILRDWRLDEPIRMEPKLFDIVWQVYREGGGQGSIQVLSAYRAPQTNAMLRRRSRAVSEHSQHMRGKALDFRIPGVSASRIREIGMRLQDGGVGFYPGAQFVHLDAGSVRSWPRMSGSELARLFPDGRTVHIPRDGRPLEGYEAAKSMILAKGGSVAGYASYAEADDTGPRKSLWAMLFGGGGGDDEDSDYYRSPASRTKLAAARPAVGGGSVFAGSTSGGDGGAQAFLLAEAQRKAQEADTSRQPTRGRGRTQLAAAPEPRDQAPAIPAGPAPGFEPPDRSGLAADAKLPDSVPRPPRRPEDLGPLLGAPLPPSRPIALASLGGSAPVLNADLRGAANPPPARQPARPAAVAVGDDRSQLRALFDAAVTVAAPERRAEVSTSRTRREPIALAAILDDPSQVRMSFSSAELDEPRPDAFRGPAVAALPILR